MGSFAGNEYLYYTPGSGLVVRGTVRADDGYLQNLTVQGLLSLNTSGELRAGDTTNGLRFGYLSDGYYLRGVGEGATQIEIKASNGQMYAGAGSVRMNASGIQVMGGNTVKYAKSLDATSPVGYIAFDDRVSTDEFRFSRYGGGSSWNEIIINSSSINLNVGTDGQQLLVQSDLVSVPGDFSVGRIRPSYASWGDTGDGGAAITNDNGTYKALMLVGNNSAGSGRRHVYVYDDLFVWGSIRASTPILCKVRRTSNQTIPSGSWTAITFDTADAEQPGDLEMWWVGNGSVLLAPITGWYHLDATVEFQASSAGTSRGLAFLRNGWKYGASQDLPPKTGLMQMSVSWTEYMLAGDYVQVIVLQDSGGNLNAVGDTSGYDKTTVAMFKLN